MFNPFLQETFGRNGDSVTAVSGGLVALKTS